MKTTIRTLALLLAALTLTLCFAACGSSSKGLVFTVNDVDLVVGEPSANVLDKLGKWISMNSSDSCGGFSGKDYIYSYSGYRVSTTPAKNGDIICKIELTDDSVKTPEGLYIGMARADAEAAMKGFNSVAVGDNLVYTADSVKLQVVFRDGVITGLMYVAA